METQTRIGLGGTSLGTVAGMAQPLFGWWVSGPIMIVCTVVAVWGFLPAIVHRWGEKKSDARRYMTLDDVVDYMEKASEWGSKKKEELSHKGMLWIPHAETLEELCSAAKNGGIAVLGRLSGTGIPQSIPATFWLVGSFDMSTLMHRQISQTKAIANRRGVPFYTDLQFSKADVYRVWRRAK
jgi:hypothetical protein